MTINRNVSWVSNHHIESFNFLSPWEICLEQSREQCAKLHTHTLKIWVLIFHLQTLNTFHNTLISHKAYFLVFSKTIDNGINENVYLFNLQVGTLYLLPEGISSCSLWRIYLGSPIISKLCFFTDLSKISWREVRGTISIIFPSPSHIFFFYSEITKPNSKSITYHGFNNRSIEQ